jgi:transaldolase/glucose-6-phosphate isomerase
MAQTTAQTALTLGQSIWYDNIRRGLLKSGDLARLLAQGVVGVTSNPAIFEKAISGSTDYDEALRRLVLEGRSVEEIYQSFVVDDIRATADLLRPIWERAHGQDGFVSVEVSPELARDTAGTVVEGLKLAKAIARENVMIKVPATPEGVPAVRELLANGVCVNVTLIFSMEQYEAVAQAYLAGLDERRRRGGDVKRLASVASFFVSRIDSSCDAALKAKMKAAQDAAQVAAAEGLLGRVGIANARAAYGRFREIFDGTPFRALKEHGAHPQRMLWASTGVKDPAYRDTYYVEELIGEHTVDTVPPATLTAFLDHGKAARTVDAPGALEEAHTDLATLDKIGVDLTALCQKLLDEGVAAFSQAFGKVMDVIRSRREALLEKSPDRLRFALGAGEAAVAETVAALDKEDASRKLWERDPAFFAVGKGAAADKGVIKQRLDFLDLPERMAGREDDLRRFVDEVRADGLTGAIVVGMGGSVLAGEVLTRTYGTTPGFLPVTVLDTTHPDALLDVELTHDLARTLVIVATKSGTTVETRCLFRYFAKKLAAELGANKASRNLAVITDPESPMVALANEAGARAIFLTPPDVAGRFSALSYFGLLPAALQGVDLEALLDDGHRMEVGCASCIPPHDNPGVRLGATLAALAKGGRNKLTVLASPEIAPLGPWIEQLVSESTGKDGSGIVTVDGEPPAGPDVYDNDRQFLYLRFGGPEAQPLDETAAALERAGFPLVRIGHLSKDDLGGEFFRWELATTVAGRVLGVYPFDEPDVEESKLATRELLARRDAPAPTAAVSGPGPFSIYADLRTLESALMTARDLGKDPHTAAGVLGGFLGLLARGDYLALCPFLKKTPRGERAVARIRVAVRAAKRVATTLDYGPRFLHSTGQLHKGGPASVAVLQVTGDPAQELPVPGAPYTFGELCAAQAAGDMEVLGRRGRRALRVHLGGDADEGLEKLADLIEAELARS